ncbi:MAG: RNA polymerase sigma factor [Stygiobacter sp.]|nr:MAG: RNA polymerase sigma factor [Stygiobacter sp.]
MQNSSQKIIEFTLAYNQHKKKLYNYAFKMLWDQPACEDIIQNTFMKLFENLGKIRNSERIEFWLFTTVRNQIYTLFRNKRIHVDQYGVADADELEIDSNYKLAEEYEDVELKEIVLAELNKMPIEQREVFLLKEYGGFSYKEISGMMNIDEELVKSRLHKTRKKLIKQISKVLI